MWRGNTNLTVPGRLLVVLTSEEVKEFAGFSNIYLICITEHPCCHYSCSDIETYRK